MESGGYADRARRFHQGHPGRQGGRRHPAQLCALRLLPARVPDLPAAGRRARQSARPHLSHEAAARGRAGRRADATAPGSLPHLPGVRNCLSLGSAVRAPARHRPRTHRAARAPCAGRAPHARRVRALLALAGAVRPLLPRAWRVRLPARAPAPPAPRTDQRAHARHVLLLAGCVQPALAGDINPAAERVLASLGIATVRARAGCCGALAHHLAAHGEALAQARRNVDLLWPQVEAGAEAVVSTASACAAMLSDYGRLLQHEPAYAARAARIAALARDVSQVLNAQRPALGAALAARAAAAPPAAARVAFQAPCTLQHALRVKGVVEALLHDAGFTLTEVTDGQRCCGSAGTYSVLQPQLAGQLLRAKVAALEAGGPDVIATANIGCLVHIASATAVPVRHWVELLAARLADG